MDGEGQHIKNQIEAAFGKDHDTLYVLLGTSSDASIDEIKRSYRRMALKHHPDRGGDAEKFKALSAIHSILTDDDRRKVYDETGDVDGGITDDISDESFEFWDNYFRALFPKVTVADITSFSERYKGSTGEISSDCNERQDILDAYQQHEGHFDRIMECVMLAEEDDEARITAVISEAIESGEVAATPAFDTHLAAMLNPKAKKQKGKKKREPSSSHSTEEEGERMGSGTSVKKKASKKSKKDSTDGGIDDLAAMILGGRSRQQDAMSSIFARYGGGEDHDDYDISDEAFERTRATLGSRSKSKTSGGAPKKTKKKQ
eukprot:CAMPEP_0114439790 /NCGR_PEP_ID=MMETSP0103-20121206/15398_1 /TAXON_ID=37642 ORGANISM="Paraphysomonas imperforata, Strain PA2" /NCGR_SAMPLE_ID=MMETSP0103 /ASSEMBLY_ACC=CAM_ASM_000201 /LENGTH=316 /DNA_ID=CAMNT_0001610599 /DNA_START=92 /DNA_END=1039 /DNA_ORIENTATION=+